MHTVIGKPTVGPLDKTGKDAVQVWCKLARHHTPHQKAIGIFVQFIPCITLGAPQCTNDLFEHTVKFGLSRRNFCIKRLKTASVNLR